MKKQGFSESKLAAMKPIEFRSIVRRGVVLTSRGVCRRYALANLVILPKEYAYDFLVFCISSLY